MYLKFKTVVYIINRHVASFFKKGGGRQTTLRFDKLKIKDKSKRLIFYGWLLCIVDYSYNTGLGKNKDLANREQTFREILRRFWFFFYSSWIFIAKYMQKSFSNYFPIISIQMDLPRDTSIQITFHELLENGQNLICYKRGVVNH